MAERPRPAAALLEVADARRGLEANPFARGERAVGELGLEAVSNMHEIFVEAAEA